jgi:hypothetical protein
VEIEHLVLCQSATKRDGLMDMRGAGATILPLPCEFKVVAFVLLEWDQDDSAIPVVVTLDKPSEPAMTWEFKVTPKSLDNAALSIGQRREIWDFPLTIGSGLPGRHNVTVSACGESASVSCIIKVSS